MHTWCLILIPITRLNLQIPPSRLHRYSYENAPIQKELAAIEVGNVAAFLSSSLASGVTGHVMYVDNGLNAMGVAVDSKTLERAA